MNTARLSKLQNKARELLAAGRTREARDTFAGICEMLPSDPNAWYTLGALSGQLGDYPGSEKAFLRLCQIAPANPQARLSLGKVQEAQGRLGEAESSYRSALGLAPASIDAALSLGMLLGRCDRYPEAIELLRGILQREPGHGMAKYCLAAALEGAGDFAGALQCYREALGVQPANDRICNSMGVLLQKMGNPNEARQAYERAISLNPGNPVALYNLGALCLDCGQYREATGYLREALRLNPVYPQAHVSLGRCLFALGDSKHTLDHYREAIAIDPRNVEAYVNLGQALQVYGRSDEAGEAFARALELDSSSTAAVAGLADVEAKQGNYDAAARRLLHLIDAGRCDEHIALAFAAVSGKTGQRERAVELLRQQIDNVLLTREKRVSIHYMLGRLLDSMREYDAAFAHFASANSSQEIKFDEAASRESLERMRRAYPVQRRAEMPTSGCMSEQPVFIVGMPRSGTTLVEQILASHPEVAAAGELPYIGDIADDLHHRFSSMGGYPECAAHLDANELARLAEQYLKEVWARADKEAGRITDKMPHNFADLGLISQLFPRARVVHCVRDPMDTCLSIYTQRLSANHPYSANLTALGRYYRQYYEPLMAHWRAVCPLPVLELRYEDMVNDQMSSTEKLLDFCGLGWDEACLRFHETSRAVVTPSHEQVRTPIYRNSLERWRNYEGHLAELRQALNDAG